MATLTHTSSLDALRRGCGALHRCASTRATLARLRQVDIALAAGDARRANAIMNRIRASYGVEPDPLAPRPRRDLLTSTAIAGAVLAGIALVTLASCGAAHAASLPAIAGTAGRVVLAPLCLAGPIFLNELLDWRFGFIERHLVAAFAFEAILMTGLLMMTVLS